MQFVLNVLFSFLSAFFQLSFSNSSSVAHILLCFLSFLKARLIPYTHFCFSFLIQLHFAQIDRQTDRPSHANVTAHPKVNTPPTDVRYVMVIEFMENVGKSPPGQLTQTIRFIHHQTNWPVRFYS